MTLEEALLEIQSYEFSNRLNVVSSMRAFFEAARKEPAVTELYEYLRKSGEAHEEVLGVIHDLSQLEVDRHYENPQDTSLAVLLWMINFAAPDYAQMSADLVDRAPQCWYAKKLARGILVPPPAGTGNFWAGEYSDLPGAAGNLSGIMMLTMNPTTALGRIGRIYHGRPSTVASTVGDFADSAEEKS